MAGNYTEARPQFERWLALVAKQPPQLTPERAEQLGTLSRISEFSGQTERADTLARQLLAIDRALYGERSYRVASDLAQLGGLETDLGHRAVAESLLRASVVSMRSNYPDGHPQLASSLRNLGYLLVDMERWTEADTVWRESAAEYRRFGGIQGVGYANAMAHVGHVQATLGQSTEAERTLRVVLTLAAARRPPPNPVADRARVFLGEALLGQARFTEAEPLLLAGYVNVRGSQLSPGTRRVAARALVRLYESEGRANEAAKYRGAARLR